MATFGGTGTAGVVTVSAGGSVEGGQNGVGTLALTDLNFANVSGTAAVNVTPAGGGYTPITVSDSGGLTAGLWIGH